MTYPQLRRIVLAYGLNVTRNSTRLNIVDAAGNPIASGKTPLDAYKAWKLKQQSNGTHRQ